MELFAFAVVVRWVVAPAINTYFRREFAKELGTIAAFPLAIQRLEAAEKAVAELAGVPETLARIEEQLRQALGRPIDERTMRHR